MTADLITLADEDMLLEDAVALAESRRMYLITNGTRAVISPLVPAGWQRIAVRIKTPTRAALEVQTCAH